MAKPEPYRIRFSSRARRDMDELPLAVATAVADAWEGYRSARRGGHRAIYLIDEAAREVLVVHVGPRADVYGGG